jgi:hypothetical protein
MIMELVINLALKQQGNKYIPILIDYELEH